MSTDRAAIHPRKMPVQRRSMAAVDAIYEASARILEESGLAALNTNLAAERAGVSVGSLYQYFPSKEAILAGLLHRKRQELLADMRRVAADHRALSLETVVERLLNAALRHYLERPVLSRTLEYAEAYLPLDQETAQLKAEIGGEIAKVLADRDIANATLAARDIVGMARGMMDASSQAGDSDASALITRIKAAVLGYLDRMRG
ncbi:TetR/AcrR family transcriptional regulator [Rhizobium sp. L1K21]|uniref:TetR/AcrR family transcriptional regulator n=1 Tax=Rhizobium sp. L1K21 TaxID=2954933 RepID=UPI0020927818|nr:TetR/AcrR family transcriptional regulator [Rhizobium sp. L1K21]MCO6186250.1 TetR/AcrR family transcriptional regulator [Rhizobium sp. L1K21]